jgi:hypothetical protein
MSLTRKTDVKSHLSARGRSGSGPFQPGTLSDATGISSTEISETEVDAIAFVEDFTGEHSPHSAEVASISKSAQE